MSRCFTINSARIRITLTVEHNLHYLEGSEKRTSNLRDVCRWMEHGISLIFFFHEKMGEFEGWKQGINTTYILFKPKGKFWIYFNKEKISKRKQKSTLPQSCPPFYVQIWLPNAWASIRPGVESLSIKRGSVEKSCESKGNESWKDPFPLQE